MGVRAGVLNHRCAMLRMFTVTLTFAMYCAGPATAEDISKIRQGLISWTSTAVKVARAWHAGAVPSAYAARSLRTAARRLAEQADAVGRQDDEADREHLSWQRRILFARDDIDALRTAIERDNHEALATSISRIEHTARAENVSP